MKWFSPELNTQDYQSLEPVFSSSFINEGGVAYRVERWLESKLDVEHAVLCTSGTSALFLSLVALGIGQEDEVLVPDLTFIASANAVKLTGANVKLIDIDPENLCVSLDSALQRITPKTKALISVDINGRAPDYSKLIAFCNDNGLELICDSAEAFLSRQKKAFLGTLGKVGCYSFSPLKLITSGQGGLVVTNDAVVADRVRALKNQGRSSGGTGGDDIHSEVGYNFKFTDLQACLLESQLLRVEDRITKIQNRNQRYRNLLCKNDQLAVPKTSEEELVLWSDVLSPQREKIAELLTKNNIGFRKFWKPLHQQKPYLEKEEFFPNATKASAEGLWLPSSFDISGSEIDRVCELIQEGVK